MEASIGVWQGQLRTIKHYTEAEMKKIIEVDGVLFPWLIPFTIEILNTCKVGTDGRTPYERITEHKCKHMTVGVCEVVDFMLECDKGNKHKADSSMMKRIFLGYVWRTTEYLVGNKESIFKCHAVRRREEDEFYDPECANELIVSYNVYVLTGAKTTTAISFPTNAEIQGSAQIPVRGREFVARRTYTRASDYLRHGYTQGCKGCT